ncbi:MAG TPA: YezD family protein [Lacipirellulaceae bacterium]|jgi:hypothetical protein
MESTPHIPVEPAATSDNIAEYTWDEVRASLRNLKFGSVTIIVQDGVIIQIDRTEKRRLQSRRGNANHAQ